MPKHIFQQTSAIIVVNCGQSPLPHWLTLTLPDICYYDGKLRVDPPTSLTPNYIASPICFWLSVLVLVTNYNSDKPWVKPPYPDTISDISEKLRVNPPTSLPLNYTASPIYFWLSVLMLVTNYNSDKVWIQPPYPDTKLDTCLHGCKLWI